MDMEYPSTSASTEASVEVPVIEVEGPAVNVEAPVIEVETGNNFSKICLHQKKNKKP